MATDKHTHSLLADYLTELGVPHTDSYSLKRQNSMPFQTLFGLSKLLQEYNVKSVGYNLSDKSELQKITPPFLADTPAGVVIVTSMTPETITYLSQGVEEKMDFRKFTEAFDGNVLLSFPEKNASEPDFATHSRLDFFIKAKKWVLAAAAIFLLLWLVIANGLYMRWSTVGLILIDLAGLYFTYLLVQKSVNIHNPAADRVCGVLQAGGCDSILSLKASKFFGIFGWSEVGFAYFSVSLITLLLLPGMLPELAVCNLICLPFTVWSIWYQRFRAHRWCTLCVCVQCSLWLLFFCYCFGGWLKDGLHLSWSILPLGAAYIAVMLGLNAVMPLIENANPKSSEENV